MMASLPSVVLGFLVLIVGVGTVLAGQLAEGTGEGTAGTWLKSAFEEEYPDVTIEYSTPQNGVTQFIQRAQQGAPIDADLYVGLNTGELVRADENLDEPLFADYDLAASIL